MPDAFPQAEITIAALTIGQASQGLTFTAFTPALAAMARDFNAHGSGMIVAQQSVTIAAAGLILGAFVSGWVAEQFGERRTALASLIAFGIFGTGGLFLNSAWALLTSRVLVGFAAACLVTACMSTIAATYNNDDRAKVIGASSAMGSAAALIGLVAGGALAQAAGWRMAFIQFPVFACLGIILVFAGVPARPLGKTAAGPDGSAPAKVWPIYLLTIVITAVMFMGSTQLAFLLPQDGIRSTTEISWIMSTITIMATLVSLTFGPIERRIGIGATVAAGFGCCAAGMGLIGTVSTPLAATLGAALIGVYVGIAMPYIYHAVMAKTASPRAIGLLNAFNFAGALINPFIFAPISRQYGLHHLFLFVGILMVFLAAGALTQNKVPQQAFVQPH